MVEELPAPLLVSLGVIVLACLATAEIGKRLFYRREARRRTPVYR